MQIRIPNTLDHTASWEPMNYPNFNYGEFAIIRQLAGANSFKISGKELIATVTNHTQTHSQQAEKTN
jgi:hypothetical protein